MKRDFIADQEALVRALGGDLLSGGAETTGQGAYKLVQITATNRFHHVVVAEEIQTTSLDVTTGTDPKFPPNAIVLEERGYKKDVTKNTDSGSIQGVQMVQFDDRYQMQGNTTGRYVIADWDLNEQPVAAIPSPAGSPPASPSPAPSASPSVPMEPGSLAGASPTPPIPSGSLASRHGVDPKWSVGLLMLGLVLAAVGGAGLLIVRPGGAAAAEARASGAAPDPAPAVFDESSATETRVIIRTMGQFSVVYQGVDYAPAIRKRPLQAFVLLYLLMLSLDGERRSPTRHSVAEEVYPGFKTSTQDERMRSLLRQRKTTFPPAIANLIRDGGKTMRFDLDASLVDAHQVLVAADAVKLDHELRSEELREGVTHTLEKMEGRFLDFWEELAGQATGGRGETEALVAEIRSRLEAAGCDLLLAQGRNALWRGDAQTAIDPLRRARQLRPDRQDVASVLVDAHRASGRDGEAESVRNGDDLQPADP